VVGCREEDAMSDESEPAHLVVRCECGFEARGPEDELVPMVQRHGRDAHNMEVTRDQVLAMARPA
jgi:predicted small metal-binding protein